MRLTLLANPDNLHVRRWITFLAGRGHALTLITDPFTRQRLPECVTLVPRWNLFTNILAFRLTPKPHGNDRWKYLHYRPLICQSRPDLIHGFEAYNYGLATAWAGPYPKVLTPWGDDIYRIPQQNAMARRMVRRALHGVDAITTNDPTLPEFLEREFGIERDKVMPFSWGVDLDVFHPGYGEHVRHWCDALDLPSGAPVIFSPRNFDPHWGSELLMKAIPLVLRQESRVVFVIVRGAGGKIEIFEAAQRQAEREGFTSAVRWIERLLAPAEMAALFNLALAFVSAPRSDLLAQTILEGMACGCLPVLADHPTYRKHLRPGENGLALKSYSGVALADTLIQALRNESLRMAAREELPRRMREHENWNQNALQMEQVYQAARDRHNRRADRSL